MVTSKRKLGDRWESIRRASYYLKNTHVWIRYRSMTKDENNILFWRRLFTNPEEREKLAKKTP